MTDDTDRQRVSEAYRAQMGQEPAAKGPPRRRSAMGWLSALILVALAALGIATLGADDSDDAAPPAMAPASDAPPAAPSPEAPTQAPSE